MITTYEFPNQWNWRLFLAINDDGESLNDILNHLNEKEGCEFLLNDDDEISPPCFAAEKDSLIGVICIDKFTFTPKGVMLVIHELTHMMIVISEVNGCQINDATTECWAYFMGNMTQMILEILNSDLDDRQTLKSKSKRNRKV
jgi:hypothetical protein